MEIVIKIFLPSCAAYNTFFCAIILTSFDSSEF
jgi:hypothetical protein